MSVMHGAMELCLYTPVSNQGYTFQHCCTTFVDLTMLERLDLCTHVCLTFFVGQMLENLSNIRPTKNAEQTWVQNVLTLSDQQMLYNNVGTCSLASEHCIW